MKTTLLRMLMALGMIAVLTACDDDDKKVEETPPAVVTVAPTCTLVQGLPTGYGMGVLDVLCSGELSIDGVIIAVKFVAGATSIKSSVVFSNLQPEHTYKGELNVVADGEPLEPVFGNLVTGSYETPAPTPEPEPEPTPEPEPEPEAEPTPQEICEDNGGYWDTDANRCSYL